MEDVERPVYAHMPKESSQMLSGLAALEEEVQIY
jgi:hypothetical protein